MPRLLLSLFAFLLVCAGAHAQSSQQVSFPTLPGAAGPALTIPATIYRPDAKGPFPAVVLLHSCSGIDSDLHAWARRLAGQGYVTIVPDSFTPRGVSKVCATGAVTLADRVPDAYAAADYLRSLPDVRGDRIGLLGFSHGGGTITQLIQQPPLSKPFRAAVGFYPGCNLHSGKVNVPTLVLVGANDDWTPAPPCSAWAQQIGNPDLLNVVVYPGAYHRFDGRNTVNVRGQHNSTHHLEYNAAASEDANARAEAFLAKWLKQ